MRVLGCRSPLHVPAVESHAIEPFFILDAVFAPDFQARIFE